MNHRARFGLSSPRDLMDKLKHDLVRLHEAEIGQAGVIVAYTGMDCAVTVVAIRDWTNHWCIENGKIAPDFETRCPHFRIIREVANGLKHFVVDRGPLTNFATGGFSFRTSHGKPIPFPHTLWIGHNDDMYTVRPILEELAQQIEEILSELVVIRYVRNKKAPASGDPSA